VLVSEYTLDKIDIEILRVLIHDCRTSYRIISQLVGLSTNAAKARVYRLVSSGMITRYFITLNHSVFGYSKIYYVFLRTTKKMEVVLNRIKDTGNLIVEVEGMGGTLMLAIAIKPEQEGPIQFHIATLKPALIRNLFVEQSFPLRLKLRKTDFMIIKCLLHEPRMEVSEIAKRISMSAKTVTNRLTKMKNDRIIVFNVATDPLKMKSHIRYSMFIRLRKKDRKVIIQVQEIMEKYSMIALHMINYNDLVIYQLIVSSVFDIDFALKRIESIVGVDRVEAFVPFRAKMHQYWIINEIDKKINVK
jgi:DNA-binding Lrp family transcriptional regulator